MAVIYPTDDQASNEASDDKYPEDFGYWDPVTDTYRSKRTHEPVPEENTVAVNDPTDNEIEASSESSDDEYPEDFGYWDPVTDTYRSKRTHEPVPEEPGF